MKKNDKKNVIFEKFQEKILNGKVLAEKIKEGVKAQAQNQNEKPCLACIIVEGDSASEIYVSSKIKACDFCGLKSKVVRLKNNISQEKLEREIEKLNKDKCVSGILLQLPLPKHLDESKAINLISPKKDVDCLTYENLGKLFCGKSEFAPCTATGIVKLLEENGVKIEGKNVVVVGRSLLVGRSVASLLLQKNATVTICHRKTQNLKSITKNADILIVAIGKAKFITTDFVKKGAVVVDVGINRIDGKLFGDVDFENVVKKAGRISPVPGGVGPLTVACLMENTSYLFNKENN